jgi:hypothetical protein
VSVATPPSPTPTAAPPPALETCPLCGAPLDPEQEWCLRCGAAARTRLAASPAWKGPVLAIAVVVTLSLGVLAAALVSLAGGSGHSTALPARTTVTTVPIAPLSSSTTTTPGAATPGTTLPSTTAPGKTTIPGATTSVPSTKSPRTPSVTTPTSNPPFTPNTKKR